MYGYLLSPSLILIMLIIALVQRRLILVTIDELHLCTKQQWGGGFRPPAMGKLDIMRNRLLDHVPWLCVTATLTRAMYREVVASAGFRKQHLDRHPINRPNAFYNFEATAESIGTQKRVILLIANATKSQYQYNANKLTKSLFFVTNIGDTIYLKRSIILWLTEFGFTEAGVIPYIEVYHGELSDATRRRKQRGFETGTIRILGCTIAFAIGVNPRGVQLVCQIGRCPPEDAIQKGGEEEGGREQA
jgi:superfamily II DNA helicase RecQ